MIIILFAPLIGFGTLDTTNFEKHTSKIELKPYFVIQKLSLKLGEQGNIVTYEPGLTGSAGLNISYKFINLSLGRSVISQKMGALDKESKYYDIRLSSYRKRFGFDINFQWFIGFSVANFPSNVSDSLKNFVRPNLDLVNYGINFYYSINNNLSLQSIYSYKERQLKSAGSLIVGLYQNYTELSYSSTIFPEEFASEYQAAQLENTGDFYTIIPTIGYQYHLVKKNLHISPFASFGFGGQHQNYSSNEKGDFNGFRRVTTMNFNLPIGYNGDDIYYGVIGKYRQTISAIQHSANMNYSLFSLNFFIGIRFK